LRPSGILPRYPSRPLHGPAEKGLLHRPARSRLVRCEFCEVAAELRVRRHGVLDEVRANAGKFGTEPHAGAQARHEAALSRRDDPRPADRVVQGDCDPLALGRQSGLLQDATKEARVVVEELRVLEMLGVGEAVETTQKVMCVSHSNSPILRLLATRVRAPPGWK
jgi:hypothetical protein